MPARLLNTAIAASAILMAVAAHGASRKALLMSGTEPAVFPPAVYGITGFDNDAITSAISACQADDPPGGCAFEFPAGTFADIQVEWPPEARSVSGAGQGVTIIQGPIDPGGEPIFLREPRDGGFATSFYDMTIDGRKQSFPSDATVGNHHNCIQIDDPTTSILKGGEIKRVTCVNVAHEGFFLYQIEDYEIDGNTLRYLGCWDETGSAEDPWEPLGSDAALVRCGDWGAAQDDNLQTGRKTNGIGIEIGNFARGNKVRGNLVEVTTKIGIQTVTFLGDVESNYAFGTQIVSNTVRHAAIGGIVNEYGNSTLIQSNTIENAQAPWQSGDTGKGVACSTGGRRTRIIGNSISGTGGAGIDAGCSCGINTDSADRSCGVSVTGNTIDDTCAIYTATSAIDADAKGWVSPAAEAEGITITGNTITNDGCAQSTTLNGYTDVETDLL